jgi:sugar/nucleoside kinase (ribokinase family)
MYSVKTYDLLCIGNYTKDTILSPAGTMHVDGGAMNYAAHAAHQLGVKVAVVTHLAEEDRRVVEKFTLMGIDCFPTYTPESTTMRLEYPTSNPDKRFLSVASTAGSITSKDVEGLQTRAAVIGTSFRGEVGLDVIHALKQKGVFLGADLQGFVRVLKDQQLYFEPWDQLPLALPYLDVVKSDAGEAECLTGEADIYKAAKIFSQLGAKEIVITFKDGVLVYSDDEYHLAGFYSSNLSGRSGRGDTCLGAYMAMRLTLEPAAAGIWAAAVTSLKMEKLGPFDRAVQEVKALIEERYSA